ncbi:MAG: site-specific integrase, partial [Pseudomonadota bacterium]
YLFRIVVPEALRAAIGKREIKKSLGRDYQNAASQARQLAAKVDQQFAKLREQLAKQQEAESGLDAYLAQPVEQRLKPINRVTPELVVGLRSLWLASLDADLAMRREGIDDDEYDDLQSNIAEIKKQLAYALARGKADPFIPVVRSLLLGRGYDLQVPPEEERKLVFDMLPAIQEGYDALEQRQAGRLVVPDTSSSPSLPAAWEPERSDDGFSWDDLLEHWRNDRTRPEKTILDAETFLNALKLHLPKATPATLTRAQVTDWLRHERVTRGNSAKTLEKKGTLVGAMFSVALKDEFLDKNPFANFDYSRFAMKEGLADNDERQPFTLEQLKQIFSDTKGLYGITSDVGGGGYHARLWIPLLALYSGARLDEIGSLTIADVLSEPVPHFRIRRGKNQMSVREVPLHPKLIELGFLEYVEANRKAGHTSLWPKMRTRAKNTNNSEVLGKWFNRFIHETLKMPRSVVFHSFRHAFKDMCRDALIPRDLHHALTGHAKGGDGRASVGDSYGKGYSLETKLAQIKKIKIGLTLSKPKPYGSSIQSESDVSLISSV